MNIGYFFVLSLGYYQNVDNVGENVAATSNETAPAESYPHLKKRKLALLASASCSTPVQGPPVKQVPVL
jgi:hypothetical protein